VSAWRLLASAASFLCLINRARNNAAKLHKKAIRKTRTHEPLGTVLHKSCSYVVIFAQFRCKNAPLRRSFDLL
jgi:hypothetical protein